MLLSSPRWQGLAGWGEEGLFVSLWEAELCSVLGVWGFLAVLRAGESSCLCVLELCTLGLLFLGADCSGSEKSRCCPTAFSSWKLGVCAPHVCGGSSQSRMVLCRSLLY